MSDEVLDWLLSGDVSIQFQVHRDLLGEERPDLRARIEREGWGKRFLDARQSEGHWGLRYYQPKWTSTHYSLLDLRNLDIAPDQPRIRESVAYVLEHHKGIDGGISPNSVPHKSDVCLNGMFLNIAAYFRMPEGQLKSMVDFVLSEQMSDGGFNCESNYSGAVHSSLHTTISILEGFHEYRKNGYEYREPELPAVEAACIEFILAHRLYKSDRTGEVIDKRMLLLSYPTRWYYDILRGLDHFQAAGISDDPRMQDALEVLKKKRRKDGKWPVQGKHPGRVHFEMENSREPSRWNTLRALRVLDHFDMT